MFKDKKSQKNNIGESWEISGVSENISIVANGELKGEKLSSLIENYTSDLLGNNVYNSFGDPLNGYIYLFSYLHLIVIFSFIWFINTCLFICSSFLLQVLPL